VEGQFERLSGRKNKRKKGKKGGLYGKPLGGICKERKKGGFLRLAVHAQKKERINGIGGRGMIYKPHISLPTWGGTGKWVLTVKTEKRKSGFG